MTEWLKLKQLTVNISENNNMMTVWLNLNKISRYKWIWLNNNVIMNELR